MEENIFSYRGLRQLCRAHLDEIIEFYSQFHYSYAETGLEGLLEHRQVRFINRKGRFEYTKFGHFYFDEEGVMMLITDEKDYTHYHRPGILSNTLWSTVPVIFAGVDTRYKDDCNQPIFTGDIVTADLMTSFVRYINPYGPSLAGDNCDVEFRPGLKLHKEGTAFYNISHNLFEHFDECVIRWPLGQFCQYGIESDEVKKKAEAAKEKPVFSDGIPIVKLPKRIYHDDIGEAISEDCVLVYFREAEDSEDENGEPEYVIFCDNYPNDYKGETYEIAISDVFNYQEDMKAGFHTFLLYAHNHPEKTFVLCDFASSLQVPKYLIQKTALLFHDWTAYFIPNVVLPRWIFWQIGMWECIGRD